ncbi:MAG: hypothetical protein HQL45_17730 [Alphaproteobacteria bacterium]|nr:hypothetical protein [Alphaproteobacteria bacterium]
MSGNGAQTLTVTSNYTGDIYINADAVDTVRVNNDGDSWSNLGTTSFNGFTYTHYRDAVSHDLFITGGATVRFVDFPQTLIGGPLNDLLTGGAANDTIDGGLGTDTLAGGLGADIYKFGRGGSADTINNQGHGGEGDQVAFASGIATDQLWFARSGNDLLVSVIGSSDQVNVQGWYASVANHVDRFATTDGQVLLDSQVDNLVSAMAGFAPPAMGQTTLPQNYQDSLSPVIAANWHAG